MIPKRRFQTHLHPQNRLASAVLLVSASLLFRLHLQHRSVVTAAAALLGWISPIGKYWAETSNAGFPYRGTTASGSFPRSPRAPLWQVQSMQKPVQWAFRVVTLQWCGRYGTVAADTAYHPFGTLVYVPSWGHGQVEDVGGGVRGADRLDLFFDTREQAMDWGLREATATFTYLE